MAARRPGGTVLPPTQSVSGDHDRSMADAAGFCSADAVGQESLFIRLVAEDGGAGGQRVADDVGDIGGHSPDV